MRNNILKITLGFSCFFTFLFIDVASARNSLDDLRALVKSTKRPSVHDVWEALGRNVPDHNPLGTSGYEAVILSSGPQTIAELEGAFPGGTYAALGRDAFFISDILSAFYLFNGLSDEHVRKLHASTATVNALVTYGGMERFLVSNGLNEKSLPFVVIDRTTFSANSQTTYLYNTIQNWAHKRNLPQTSGAVVSTTTGRPFSNYIQSPSGSNNNYTPLNAGMASNLDDFGFWTDTYSATIRTDSTGAEVGVPTKHNPEITKLGVISLLVDLIRVASTAEFNNAVKTAARNLGFNLESSLSKRAKLPRIVGQAAQSKPSRAAEPITWRDFFDGLGAINHSKGYLSANGNALLAQIDLGGVPNTLNSDFVTYFFAAHSHGKFSSKDLRRVFLYIMGALHSDADRSTFLKIVRYNPALASLLSSKGEVFLTSSRYNKNAEQVYRFLVNQVAVPIHPDCMIHFKS